MHIAQILSAQLCWVETMLLSNLSFMGGICRALCKKKKKKEIEVQGDFRGKVNEKELLCSA